MKMVKGFFLERIGCFSLNNFFFVECLEIKIEIFKKKICWDFGIKIYCVMWNVFLLLFVLKYKIKVEM